METEKLKQSVLVDLRSVIQSCKGGVPLNRLQNDYKLLVGTTIPFMSLGYNSLETFLQSIPQVVRIKKNSEGQLTVEAVADSSTVHLQNLISKQKSTKSQKCSVKRYGKRPAPKTRPSLCPNCSIPKSAFNNSTGGSSNASSSWSVASEVSSDKNKEIEALKSKLAEQKGMNAALKSKLAEQHEMNISLKSKVSQLVSQSEPHLEYVHKQIMIQRMKYQIGLLQKRILLRHSASPEALQVNRKINEIVEKFEDLDTSVEKLNSNSTKDNSPDVPNGNLLQDPKCDPIKLYEQQCKETEELKKQVQAQSSQILSIERRMQSQHQKLQNQMKDEPSSNPSKEQFNLQLVEDLKTQLQEQNIQIQNVEKNMSSEFSKLKTRVEKEYSVHLVCEAEKLKEFDKQLKGQKSQFQKFESRMQSETQRLKNRVDGINIENMANMIVKKLVARDLINVPQLLSTSGNFLPSPQQSNGQMLNLPKTSPVVGVTKTSKKKKKTNPEVSGATISSMMRDKSN